jgi:hypothetical protein
LANENLYWNNIANNPLLWDERKRQTVIAKARHFKARSTVANFVDRSKDMNRRSSQPSASDFSSVGPTSKRSNFEKEDDVIDLVDSLPDPKVNGTIDATTSGLFFYKK